MKRSLGTGLLLAGLLMGTGCSRSSRHSSETVPAPGDEVFSPLREDEGGVPVADGGRRSGPCDHVFYPIRQGYEVRYLTTYPRTEGGASEGRYFVRVADLGRDNARLEAVYESHSGPPVKSFQAIRCDHSGALVGTGYVDFGSRVEGGRTANMFDTLADRIAGELLPADVRVGSSWFAKFNVTINPLEMTKDSVIPEPIRLPIQINRRAIAEEEITVPAGKFDTIKVEMQMVTDKGTFMTGTEWWGRNAGLVKSVFQAGGGDIVTVATSVHVPR